MASGQLQPWSETLESHFLTGFFGTSFNDTGNVMYVRPAIQECMFCCTKLKCAVKKQGGVASANGGLAWGYHLDIGAQTVAVIEAHCEQCQTTYGLQTFSPGDKIKGTAGKSCMTCAGCVV